MGIISNIIELVKTAKAGRDTFDSNNFAFKTTRNSISRKSANSILQFPVICSSALSVDDLMMVTKSLEREYCQFVRIAASLDDVIESNKPEAKLEKIRSLHQNIGYSGQRSIGMSGGKPFMESADLSYTSICEAFEKKNIELLKIVNEDLNPTILNDMTNKNNKNYYNFNEAKSLEDQEREHRMKFARHSDERANASELRANAADRRAAEIHKLQKSNLQWQNQYNTIKNQREQDSLDLNRAKFAADTARYQQDREDRLNDRRSQENMRNREFGLRQQEFEMKQQEFGMRQQEFEMRKGQIINQNNPFKDQLLPTDARKANELIPSMMDLQFIYESKYGQLMTTNILVGVKAVAHLVSSEEMVTNIASAVKEKRHFFKFLQWTTGEIEMVKDWILAKDKIKDEVKRQRSGKESKWWRRLKGRSAEDKLRRFTFNRKDILPNSTLVVTMDEVEMIANTYNINILKDRRAINSLFDTFFLLGLVIVDSATEVAYFRFDGEEDWQTQSYRSLEKESNNAADMRSMVSLMNNQNFR